MIKRLVLSSETLKRFWRKVALCEHGWNCSYCCWLWTAYIDDSGYGRFGSLSMPYMITVHRISWIIHNNFIVPPRKIDVMHTCDVRACVNYFHLVLGTRKDNMQDMAKKNRGNTVKLHVVDVKEIRRLFATGDYSVASLSREYPNIDESNVRAILRKKSWKFLQDDYQDLIDFYLIENRHKRL